MPCATLHTMVHLTSPELRQKRFPAIWHIETSDPAAPEHYGLPSMIVWATLPYAFWQLSYHFFITVRKRNQIAAGRPTSFTWLRRSYAPTWIGKFVLSLPENLQEPAFMLIQYVYAVSTMIPAPLWFWSRWASAGFLMTVFIWSIYNGAVYYIDVFGTRFQKELEKLKLEVARMQMSPEIGAQTPSMGAIDSAASPAGLDKGHDPNVTEITAGGDAAGEKMMELSLGEAAADELSAKDIAAAPTKHGKDGMEEEGTVAAAGAKAQKTGSTLLGRDFYAGSGTGRDDQKSDGLNHRTNTGNDDKE